MIRQQLTSDLQKALEKAGFSGVEPVLDHPVNEANGDYSTNVAMILAKQQKDKRGNFLENIERILKTIKKDNFEDYSEPLPVGRLALQVQKAINAKTDLVYLKPRIYAKWCGWWRGHRGHEEILPFIGYLPSICCAPLGVYRDRDKAGRYLLAFDVGHFGMLVIEILEERNKNEIITAFYLDKLRLGEYKEVLGLKNSSLGKLRPASLLAHSDFHQGVAGAISSLQESQIFYNKIQDTCQADLLHYDEQKLTPLQLAQKIVANFSRNNYLEKVVVVAPGFINFYLLEDFLQKQLREIIEQKENFGKGKILAGKKMMVEFAHPNTHKEMHIGHLRTLITGESLSRIFAENGATVFRANYQGDIGPHVAKSIWGTQKILDERKISWEAAEKLSLKEKAHLLGEGYVRGVNEYETYKQSFSANKEEIDALNKKLYLQDKSILFIYQKTRQWSLDYYEKLFLRFGTKFDRLFFESEVAEKGKEIVLASLDKVFKKSDGAIVFDGERYGLHTRVFVTADGNPTYEAKEMALAPLQFSTFPFALNIHVVASEQKGYFQVVIKALELLDSKFIGREYHLPMGMVQLVGKKMSSRTGVLITVDGLIDDVKKLLKEKQYESNLTEEEKKEMMETVSIGAIKYSVLKAAPTLNALFDLEKSVSMEGDSGPYLQYTYARTRSVLAKSEARFRESIGQNRSTSEDSGNQRKDSRNQKYAPEELVVLRSLYQFPEVVESAAKNYSPNLICSYLFDLAKRYNLFYNKLPILNSEKKELRLELTQATGQVIKNGLGLLGIKVLERM